MQSETKIIVSKEEYNTKLMRSQHKSKANEDIFIAVVDDLLNVFLGVDGSYISAKMIKGIENVHLVYILDVDMDVSLKELASKMLPLRYLQSLPISCGKACER